MTKRVHLDPGPEPGQEVWRFLCPDCDHPHWFEAKGWSWNGSTEAPTFSPAVVAIDSAEPRN